MYRSSLTPQMLVLAIALLLAGCTPVAEALAPKGPLPEDVARRAGRLDELARIKDQGAATDPYALAARLDELATIKDESVVTDAYVRAARLDELARIKDPLTPEADRDMLIARLDKLAQIKDQVMP